MSAAVVANAKRLVVWIVGFAVAALTIAIAAGAIP
jgi:hypothetical protein